MKIDRAIAIVLFLLAGLVLLFFWTMPVYREFKGVQLTLAQKKAEFNAQYEYYADINKRYLELRRRKDDLEKVDNALPQTPELGQLIYYFQKETKDAGLLMRNVVLAQASSKGGPKEVKDTIFSLDLFGDYRALRDFVKKLEKSDRIFEVTRVSFGSTGQQIGTAPRQSQSTLGLFSFNLEVKTHSY